jgi:hypothetical protein
MPPDSTGARLVPDDQPDRVKWNAKYAAGYEPSFTPHPLAVRVPPGFTLLDQSDLPSPEQPVRRQMLSRRGH